ncbi:MAG: carbohydrate kinase family protein [Clostridiales bacterium]|nr:carbohydrate kinase family protein [Clostridiales bacterium]
MDVVGIDVPCVDFLAHINRLPREADQGARLLEYSWQGGGKVATALVALARLGAKTGIVGVVGGCLYGQFCVDDFVRHGVDVSKLIIDEDGETSLSLVLSESQTCGRNIIFHRGSVRNLSLEDLDRDYITSGKYLHLAQATPVTRQAAVWARQAGNTVVFDADGFREEIQEMLPLIDVFIGSEFYYRALFDDDNYEANCRKLMEEGPSIVVFTFGEEGCLGVDTQGFFNEPAFSVPVKDTTGAGDVYHGAFIYGLLQGWSASKTARFANAVSAIKCTRIGGRAGIPTVSMVEKFMETGCTDFEELDERVKFYRKQGLP